MRAPEVTLDTIREQATALGFQSKDVESLVWNMAEQAIRSKDGRMPVRAVVKKCMLLAGMPPKEYQATCQSLVKTCTAYLDQQDEQQDGEAS